MALAVLLGLTWLPPCVPGAAAQSFSAAEVEAAYLS